MIALPLMLLVTVQHAPETPSRLVYSERFTDSEKTLQWFNVTNQSILIANLCTCICVPIMDIIFSFINMRWWTTQQASFVNHSLSMLRAFSVSFSKSKMQWHAALLKNVTSVVNSIGWFQGYLIVILQYWETSYLTVIQNEKMKKKLQRGIIAVLLNVTLFRHLNSKTKVI